MQLARRAKTNDLERRGARRLTPPSGAYNCHGLVFASRRTNVDSPDEVVDIDELLRHDGFVRVRDAAVGCVIAYRFDGKIEHTGTVAWIELVGTVPVVWVWSMWGGLGEYLHREADCPYDGSREYWRPQR